jgi:hypothetical protein
VDGQFVARGIEGHGGVRFLLGVDPFILRGVNGPDQGQKRPVLVGWSGDVKPAGATEVVDVEQVR